MSIVGLPQPRGILFRLVRTAEGMAPAALDVAELPAGADLTPGCRVVDAWAGEGVVLEGAESHCEAATVALDDGRRYCLHHGFHAPGERLAPPELGYPKGMGPGDVPF